MSTELCEPLREDEGLHSSIDASSTASSDFLQAIYCKHCDFWLNGPIKWRSHLRGYKHKKRIKALHKTQRACKPSSGGAETSKPNGAAARIAQPAHGGEAHETRDFSQAIYCKHCDFWLMVQLSGGVIYKDINITDQSIAQDSTRV